MKKLALICFAVAVFSTFFFFIFQNNSDLPLTVIIKNQIADVQTAIDPKQDEAGNYLYKGTIYHIFFHSLIVYPELAYNSKTHDKLFKDYMITRDQFLKILPELYKNNYVLIDIHSIYSVNEDGTVKKKDLYLPKGKKPLIISLDDLQYYQSQKNSGFANKLVLDANGNVATNITTSEGKNEITRDGDVVPILDDFVTLHPDFSIDGAKGIIALTGYDGIFGYRTQGKAATSATYAKDVTEAKKIAEKLKSTGWSFASHSYFHDASFSNGKKSLESLQKDTELWDTEVRPIVGDTDVFIGPFGQIFKTKDPRRQYLISKGFKMFCGVGMDLYLHYFDDQIVMDRADIDGYRLTHSPKMLKKYFDPEVVK